jgi:hypothetical protein
MQEAEQIRGKTKLAPPGTAYEGGGLVPIVFPDRADPLAEVFALLENVGCPIPPEIKPKVIPGLELILDEAGDRRGVSGLDAMTEFLGMITANSTALQIGQRVVALAYFMGKTKAKTQRGLAVLLNVTPGRITQIIGEIPAPLRGLCRLKGRTAKRRAIDGKT